MGRETKRVRAVLDALEALGSERDPLRQLDAVRRARESAEELEQLHVDAARERGRTWSEIGEVYGMTKQGAQQRFRGRRRKT